MKLSGVIDALIAAGGSPEQIAAVVRAAEAEQQAIDDARREKAASKKRAQRASERLSAFVPGTEGDDGGREGTRGDAPPLHSSSERVPPSPPKGGSSPKGARGHRGAALPDDWQPKDRHFARAAERGLNGGFIAELADRMREWAGANSNRAIARKADWDLTFDGFIRREIEKPHARAGPAERRHPVLQARDEIQAELAAEGFTLGH